MIITYKELIKMINILKRLKGESKINQTLFLASLKYLIASFIEVKLTQEMESAFDNTILKDVV